MKYLFFDIECANCYGGKCKICEFGYVLTDDSFSIKEKEVIVINPAAPFENYVIKNMLAYPEGVYRSSKKFPAFYNKIGAYVTDPDTIVIGHTIDADAKYINDDCERYNLPFFKYDFHDIKFIYSSYLGIEDEVGLEKMCDYLQIQGPKHAHRSVDDALATMAVTKEISKRAGLSLSELIEKYPRGNGKTENGIITTVVKEERAAQKAREEEFLLSKGISLDNVFEGEHYRDFFKFLDGVQRTEKLTKCEFTGKTLSVSNNYQKYHFKETINLVQILKNHGCTFRQKASECSYFVKYDFSDIDGNILECSRLKQVLEANEKGSSIKIITFSDMLEVLGIEEKELSETPLPDFSLYDTRKSINSYKKEEQNKTEYKSGKSETNLGSLLAGKIKN